MPDKELRLLALDGGGVRGLSALMILQQLMETIDPENPPKPCDCFDIIGGTSTGGLIAIMLGRLKMSIDECIDAYLQLSDRIFQKKRHRVSVKGQIQGRFDSDELEQAVKEIITKQGLQENILLKDTTDATCKVFVCATRKQTRGIQCLTSYQSPRGHNDLLNSVKVWEACRATAAASSFFDPIAIGRYKEEFVDGATGANNPVMELWNQAQLMWGPEPVEGKVQCLVSLGMGVTSLKAFYDDAFGIWGTLKDIATETEQTAEKFRRDKAYLDNSSRYFRFNVSRGLEDIGLEESTKIKEIASATREYVESQEVFNQMQACAGTLAGLKLNEISILSSDSLGQQRIHTNIAGIAASEIQNFQDDIQRGDLNAVQRKLMAVPNYKFTKFESLLQQEPPSNGLALAYYAKLFRISPLHQAIESNQLSVGKILIREGCDIDSQDSEGCTALHYAVRKGNFTFCELLMCAGASAMIPNSDNATPVYQAWATSRDTIFRLLCPNMLERMKYGIWKAFLYRKDYR